MSEPLPCVYCEKPTGFRGVFSGEPMCQQLCGPWSRPDYADLEADLIRAERAVVLLRNLVEACDWRTGNYMPEYQAARAYLADIDAGDADMV